MKITGILFLVAGLLFMVAALVGKTMFLFPLAFAM